MGMPVTQLVRLASSKLLRLLFLDLLVGPAIENAGLDLIQHLPPQLGKGQALSGLDGAIQCAGPHTHWHRRPFGRLHCIGTKYVDLLLDGCMTARVTRTCIYQVCLCLLW